MPRWRTCLPAGRIGRLVLINMVYVYAIRSLTRNYIYVGLTNDLKRRLSEHNNGENRSTKAYKPFILLYSEQVSDRNTARIREKYLKSGVGKEFIRSLG